LVDGTNGDRPPAIVGVQLDDGSLVRADAVVASSGPRSDLVRWLEPRGVVIPEVVTETGITYLTRFYRLRPGHTLPGGIVQASSRRAGLSYSCVEADNDTFSITIAVESSDRELRRHLVQTGPFDAVCRLLPGIDTVTDPTSATPMTAVHAMGGLINRQRSFLDAQGRPRVVGFHALGDAHTTTNPLYGRGCSLAMVQAVLLSDSFVDHPSDPVGRAVAYEEASLREIEPWYRFAVDGDALRSDPQVDPHDPRFTLQDLLRVGAIQPSLLPRTLRTLTLLATPDVLSGDPVFLETLATMRQHHAAKVAARRAEGYQPPLQRADLLAAGLA
jgi:2-polyprenyl-6-methoxyphenol hydroxylase-like FAD-dependent oxidoreductase